MSDNKRAAVVILVHSDGKQILGVSRGEDLQDWGLPGGGVDDGESFAAGAARELWEETGLRGYNFKSVYSDPNYKNTEVHTFKPEEVFGTMRDSDEGKVKWCTTEELMGGTYGDYNRALFQHLKLI